MKSSRIVYVHADESCLGNQFTERPNPGGAAGLIEGFDERSGWTRRDFYLSEPASTNNRMALRSAIAALAEIRHSKNVVFYSDSQYLINGMKDWIHSWSARGWRRKGGAIENLDLWHTLDRAAALFAVEWRWTRGHAGDPKNEYVNQLAVTAARKGLDSSGLIPSEFEEWLAQQQERERFLEFLDVPPSEPFRPDRPSPAAGR